MRIVQPRLGIQKIHERTLDGTARRCVWNGYCHLGGLGVGMRHTNADEIKQVIYVHNVEGRGLRWLEGNYSSWRFFRRSAVTRAHKDGVGSFFFPSEVVLYSPQGLRRKLVNLQVSSYLPPTERSEMA